MDYNQQPPPQPFTTPPPTPEKRPGKGKSIASLVLGIVALTVPIPVFDIICGIVGLVLAGMARRDEGGGMATAGLVLSIIGLTNAPKFGGRGRGLAIAGIIISAANMVLTMMLLIFFPEYLDNLLV